MLEAGVRGQGVTFPGLNEAVVGRATLSRAIQLAVDVDGIRIADYRCDGVIVASATGSTAYALSVGGPILYPESSDLIVVPVAPHLSAQHAVIVPGNETVHITLEPDQQAVLSVDGLARRPAARRRLRPRQRQPPTRPLPALQAPHRLLHAHGGPARLAPPRRQRQAPPTRGRLRPAQAPESKNC